MRPKPTGPGTPVEDSGRPVTWEYVVLFSETHRRRCDAGRHWQERQRQDHDRDHHDSESQLLKDDCHLQWP